MTKEQQMDWLELMDYKRGEWQRGCIQMHVCVCEEGENRVLGWRKA